MHLIIVENYQLSVRLGLPPFDHVSYMVGLLGANVAREDGRMRTTVNGVVVGPTHVKLDRV
jgi:hypothetical protein